MRKASSRFGGSVACGAIGLAAVQVLLANQAGAVPGLQRFVRTSASDSSTSKTVAANCPVGKRVLGGGGTVIGGRGQVILERLEPMQIATNDRFVVGAREDGTGFSGNWQLTAYALCADPIPLYGILPSTSGSPSSNSPQSTLSFCVGQPLIGFGGRINGGAGQVHLTSLVRDANGFAAIAAREDANGFDGAWTVTTYAVCATLPAPANLAARIRAIKAVRVALVVRSEDVAKADAVNATLVNQSAWIFNCAANDATCQGRIQLDNTILQDYGRYRIYEATIPLRNAIWNQS